ncbi:SMP-30/gluconolactonase/LRE family protein [Gynuella sp.]|uniref:SMP-30/gluconolactonase/LRE family protein n=1 Tax=Gynuella sp. TaxID=2969146 RepID=UPI003D0C85DC
MSELRDWQVLWPGENQLGEGILWHPELQTLFWVDIVCSELFAMPWQRPDLVSCTLLPFKASHVALCDDSDYLLLATNKGIAKWHITEQRLDDIIEIPQLEKGVRCNDAAVAEDGSYWVGLMSEPPEAERGCIVRVAPSGKVETIKTDISIPNTMLWHERHFIFADSGLHTLFRQPITADGSLSGEAEVLLTLDSHDQTPDGSTLATDNSIFNAIWQGQRIQQLSPSGKLLEEHYLPVYSPTSCTFCGPELDYLAVTSARVDVPAPVLEEFPLTGALICKKLPITGTLARTFHWPEQ